MNKVKKFKCTRENGDLDLTGTPGEVLKDENQEDHNEGKKASWTHRTHHRWKARHPVPTPPKGSLGLLVPSRDGGDPPQAEDGPLVVSSEIRGRTGEDPYE